MVVIYKVGHAPITYSANLFSCATFITFCLYAAAIVFPYLIAGLTLNFFPPYDIRAERPSVYVNPDMEYTLTIQKDDGTGNWTNEDLYFKLSNLASAAQDIKRVPIIRLPQKHSDRFIKFDTYFPLKLDVKERIKKVKLSFILVAEFPEMERSFTSDIDIEEDTILPACSLNVLGSLSFAQEFALAKNRKTDVPLSQEYIDFTKTRTTPVNSSNPLIGGVTTFTKRNTVWTFGECGMFNLHFSMRVPIIKTYAEKDGWYSFLDGWTTYIAIAIPLFIIVRMALGAFFKSGMIPIQKEVEGELNSDDIPKFNR